MEPVMQCLPYLRRQADRCQRLSRTCIDLGVARDLRLMAEEYYAEAPRLNHTETIPAPATDE
jgi:hypothetical protein